MTHDDVPAFDDLPMIEKLGLRHSWGVFGDDDIGTINHLTPERVRAAAGLVRAGDVFDLSWPLNQPDPPLYLRTPYKHEIYPVTRNDRDERIDNFYPQGSTQWDGLRHVRCREYGFYTGITEEFEPGPGRLGIEHIADHGMVGRGVLVDVTRYLESIGDPLDHQQGRSITAEEIAAAARSQGVQLRPGDILCIRLGWAEEYEQMTATDKEQLREDMSFPGLAADEDMARFLWNSQVAAVAVDNPAFEVSPGDPAIGSLHRRLIPMLGMPLGEFFRFGALSRACQEDNRWDFMFTAVPLKLPGAVGSPANAIAVR